ncbi:SGNH/GDSL hydrolase family protein [Chitinophaga sp. GCM10012297]|uniref:SGNH/GDSL hydrolase family protein n=1 Tax=Chitinophaga chungangae TaxID=2821488 RepID=A0ABS3YJF1_9BACT|nr:SGNH/GDSL hydrolase family protein [Chitinophaga chungangae]MBO9154818.1 SGNH/GDSL hydrolase family protein [Chitinophaga chungangae]
MRSVKNWLLIVFCLVAGFSASAQVFKKGDRVAFVGNSITHNGDFWHNVSLWYATRYPQLGVTFFNCGISGDVTKGILDRMDEDILVHQPTWAVIMIGMNDVNRPLYDKKRVNEPGIKEQQQQALATYKKKLDSIIRVFQSKNIKVILQTPSIYDQTSKMATNNLYGVNDALKTCAGYVREFAAKYKVPVVDYWTSLSAFNAEVQRTDSNATVIGKDRVHPGAVGHLLMGWEFLKTFKSSPIVATVVADRDVKSSQAKCQQAKIAGLVRDGNTVTFTATEQALPFPLRDEQAFALELAPFTENFNRELLRFNFLKPGNYVLSIDDVEIGQYFSGELERGVNLALITKTPQYEQAKKVQALLQNSWKLEAQLRQIRRVEYRYMNTLPGRENLAVVKHYYDTAMAKRPDTDYMKKTFAEYLEQKPKEAEIRRQWASSLDSLPVLLKPAAHKYVLKKI